MSVLLRYRPTHGLDRSIIDMSASDYEHNNRPMQRSSAPTSTLHLMTRSLTGNLPPTDDPSLSQQQQQHSCRCCPYGYHIDLDFVRYCEDLTQGAAAETSEEQRLRRDRRRQRKSMEVMLGFEQIAQMQTGKPPAVVQSPLQEEDPFELFDVSPGSIPSSTTNGFHFNDTSRVNLHLRTSKPDQTPQHVVRHSSSPPRAPPRQLVSFPASVKHSAPTPQRPKTPPAPPARRSRANSERLAHAALEDACVDFERTLLRSNSMRAPERHQSRSALLNHDKQQRLDDKSSSVNIDDTNHTTQRTWKLRSPESYELDVSELDACLSAAKPTSTAQLRHPALWTKPAVDRTSYYSYTPSATASASSVQQQQHETQPAHGISSGFFPSTYVVANPDHETDDRESVTSNSSEISTGTLQNIRDQMATSLRRMRHLEEQVKQVPILQQQLKQLRDEKRVLTQQLRHPEPNPIPAPQRVSPVSLEGLNVLLPKENSFNDVFFNRKSRKAQAPLPPSPRGSSVSSSTPYDESITSESPASPSKRHTRSPVVTRDIGIATNQQPILHSRGTNCDVRLYTKQELEAAIDLTIAKQTQARHKRSSTVSTQFSPPPHPPKTTRSTYVQTPLPPSATSVATMTSPTIQVDASTSCRPATRTTGSSDHSIVEAPCPKCSVRTRTVSVGPDQQIDPINSSVNTKASQQTPLISLKSMGLPTTKGNNTLDESVKPSVSAKQTKTVATQVTPRPSVLTTVGTQVTCSSGVHVACQHTPPKHLVQHKLTDTRGLIRHHHQSTGPEQSHELIDQSTNTALQPFTVHRATNTAAPPAIVHNSTSPDPFQSRDVASSTEEPETPPQSPEKPPHIQLNCPFGCPNNSGYCDNCKEAIRGIAREVAFNSTMSLQKSGSSSSVTGASPVSEFSRIPRPTTLLSPRPERRFVRQTTYTIQNTVHTTQHAPATSSSGAASEDDEEKTCPAELFLRRLSQSSGAADMTRLQSPIPARRHQSVAPNNAAAVSAQNEHSKSPPRLTVNALEEEPCDQIESRLLESPPTSLEETSRVSARMNRTKVAPSREMKAALKVINDAILQKQQQPTAKSPGFNNADFAASTQSASRVVQAEWFQVSSTDHSNPLDVEDYLDAFEDYSTGLLRFMVNMADTNGNTAMHYAVSHGNFDVVSILLDSKECDANRTNNAGYTCVMLVSLAQLKDTAHHSIVKRLFQMSDVNIRAKKHSQTALMLAVSHGNVDMVKMLLAAGADINIQDEDGSTALMCAAEHGRIDIVKLLLAQPDCDSTVHDVDGSTALKISLEAGHRDIGVLLYAHEHITRSKSSPYTSLRRKKEPAGKPLLGSSSARGSRTAGGSNSMPSSPMSSRKFLPGDHHPPTPWK